MPADPRKCLTCGSEYLGDINPSTGFPWHYCAGCRKNKDDQQHVVADIRRSQSDEDKKRQLSLLGGS